MSDPISPADQAHNQLRLANLAAATQSALNTWNHAKLEHQRLITELEQAQRACNKSEVAYYEAFDREADFLGDLTEANQYLVF